MIKLKDGQITDILPEKIANDLDTRCLSYAIWQEHRRVIEMVDRTRTMAVIDELPEGILDILAVELRTPYYQESMDMDTKRNIIKRTLSWHTKAGTPSAVSELISIIFGEGGVVEWFNYDEPPYTPGTFDIITNAQMTEEMSDYFLAIIQRVKNTRSHIRRIFISRGMDADWKAGAAAKSGSNPFTMNHTKDDSKINGNSYGASGVVMTGKPTIANNPIFDSTKNQGVNYIASGMNGHQIAKVDNNQQTKAGKTSHVTFGVVEMQIIARQIITSCGINGTVAVPNKGMAAAFARSIPKSVISN